MNAPRDPEPLQDAVGWHFHNSRWLTEALTHSTFANEHPGAGPDNERLEFLGDAVLGLLVARLLYAHPNGDGEGEMSRRRARVVRREALARLATRLDLGSYLRLGEGQRAEGVGGRILADAYEALVGAIFLDGGFAAIEQCFATLFSEALEAAAQMIDFKTRLQEVCHSLGLAQPHYAVVAVEGPDHAKRYSCEVQIGGRVYGRGRGSSKKIAQQECAGEALPPLEAQLAAKEGGT